MFRKLKNEVNQTFLLLKNVPALMVSLFVVSVIGMNVLAQQAIVNESWIALDGGIFLSWLSFLGMDTIVKRFGPKASVRISVFAVIVNFVFFAIQQLVTVISISAGLKGSTICDFVLPWWVLLASTAAFVFSAIVNSYINDGIGKLFKKNPNGKLAYVTRTYVSTFIGQFLDNLVFAFLCGFWASRVIEGVDGLTIYMDGFLKQASIALSESQFFSWWGNAVRDDVTYVQPMTILGIVMMAFTGAVAELLSQVIFSPIGYKTAKKWESENIGIEYLTAEKEIDDLKVLYKEQKKANKEKLAEIKADYQINLDKIINYKYSVGERI